VPVILAALQGNVTIGGLQIGVGVLLMVAGLMMFFAVPASAAYYRRAFNRATETATQLERTHGEEMTALRKEASAAQEEFAELQKKYAGILGSKQSEVQIISGQTGSWHRLVATPASTKAAANEICNDLRSAGYGRCWVKAY
jgi:hypothetical protein